MFKYLLVHYHVKVDRARVKNYRGMVKAF